MIPRLLGVLTILTVLTGCRFADEDAPTTQTSSPWNLDGPTPHLIAHYVPWFTTQKSETDATFTWDHWQWQGPGPTHDPNLAGPRGRRDIASVVCPLIGPYASWSPRVVKYHLATAKAAGIQAMLVLWYGPGNDLDARIPMILDVARETGTKIAICYEEKINWPGYRNPESREDIVKNATADLQYILDRYAGHAAYLRRNGQPFICQFNYWGAGELGPNNILPDEWTEIFARLSQPVVYARQNFDEMYHPRIAGAYVWWTDDDWPRRFAQLAHDLIPQQKLVFAMTMICPGFDDAGVWGWGNGPRKSKEYGMPVLQRTCAEALIGSPELIQIVTWNDFNEGTAVEPSLEYGYQWLDAIEQWLGKTQGRPVNLDDNRDPLREYLRTCSELEKQMLPEMGQP
ncbi:MAG: hypothetical protein IT440_05035 [Phycisphaeraceae bacterium]|nr:hypothetical protein [Phycisphaeraceae bacterium]